MRHAAQAIATSIAVHVLLAALFVAGFLFGPEPDSPAVIDVSAVELSISDGAEETPSEESPEEPWQESPLPVAPQTAALPPAAPRTEARPLPPDPDSLRVDPPESEVAQIAEFVPRRSEAPAQQQAHVDAPPRPLMTIRPVYPRGARRRGEQGDVSLDIRVDETGEVDGVDVASSSGFAELDAAAADAVRAARFEPARSSGLSIASTARLKLSFRLR